MAVKDVAALDSMQRAMARMVLKHPFFASMTLSTRLVQDENIPTAATDMRSVFYNTKFIKALDDDTVMFVFAHEIMHIMLKHGIRRGSRHPIKWNIAADHAINIILKKSGFKLWEHCCCDMKFDGMSAEQIYEQREKDREANKGKGQPDKHKPGQKGEGYGDNGSDDVGEMGEDVLSPGELDPESRAEIERTIDQHVAQAANTARAAGKFPGEIQRIVDGILNPPLTWFELLREYMQRVAQPTDETWNKRNRRFNDVYLPSRHTEAMGEIVVIGDTSGSMGGAIFAQIGVEINEIREAVHPERVRIIWADDAECSLEEIFEQGEEVVLHPKGGGGTDMRKPLAHVEQFDPVVVVLVTDGLTPWPEGDPPYPLIVLCNTQAPVPIGQCIRIE